MVSNILDMSKIAAGKMQLSPVPADLRELAARIIRVSRSRAEGKSVRLSLECDSGLPAAVEVDTQRLEQVLLNLVSNSIKFTNPKGCVVVKLHWQPLSAAFPENDVKAAIKESSWRQTMELEEVAADQKARMCNWGLVTRYMVASRPSSRGRKDAAEPSVHRRKVDSLRIESSPTVEARADRGIVKIEVMDTGIGISKEGIAKLFHPYQQAEAGISRFVPRAVLTFPR